MEKKQKLQKGLRVDVRNNDVDSALMKMKRMVKDSGLMVELRKRTYYEKPSTRKRNKIQKNKKTEWKFIFYIFIYVIHHLLGFYGVKIYPTKLL